MQRRHCLVSFKYVKLLLNFQVMLDRYVKFQDLKPLPPAFPTLVSMVTVWCRMLCPTSLVAVDLDIKVGA